MPKYTKILIIITFIIINTIIAFAITNILDCSNTIIYKLSFSIIYSDVTLEVIIFFILSIIESLIYKYFSKKYTLKENINSI